MLYVKKTKFGFILCWCMSSFIPVQNASHLHGKTTFILGKELERCSTIMVILAPSIRWLISICNILLLVDWKENSVVSVDFEHRTYAYTQFLWGNVHTKWEMERNWTCPPIPSMLFQINQSKQVSEHQSNSENTATMKSLMKHLQLKWKWSFFYLFYSKKQCIKDVSFH